MNMYVLHAIWSMYYGNASSNATCAAKGAIAFAYSHRLSKIYFELMRRLVIYTRNLVVTSTTDPTQSTNRSPNIQRQKRRLKVPTLAASTSNPCLKPSHHPSQCHLPLNPSLANANRPNIHNLSPFFPCLCPPPTLSQRHPAHPARSFLIRPLRLQILIRPKRHHSPHQHHRIQPNTQARRVLCARPRRCRGRRLIWFGVAFLQW